MKNLETEFNISSRNVTAEYSAELHGWRSATAVFGVAAFATLSAVGARLVIDTKPVPFTLQVFFVLLAGMVLGRRLGAISQVVYIGMGIAGLPVFASPPYSGIQYLLGPTGGYLIGFVFGAYVTGLVRDRLRPLASKIPAVVIYAISGVAGIATLYTTGFSWLTVWMMSLKQNEFFNSLALAWKGGVAPFILIDTVKSAAAAVFASGATLAGAWAAKR